MTRFLRLFSAFRALESERDLLKGIVEDLRAVQQRQERRIEDLTLRLDESRQGEVKATQTVADFMSQIHFGRKIYDHVPELPKAPNDRVEPVAKKAQASDLVAKLEREFLDELKKTNAQ